MYMEYKQDTQITTSKSRQCDWLKNQVNNIFLDNLDCPENATDEEQEDLPYDEGLEGTYQHTNESDNLKASTTVENISANFLNLTCSEINSSLKEEVNYETKQLPQEKVFQHHTPATRTNGITIEMATEAPVSGMSFERKLSGGTFSSPGRKEHFTNSKISDVLLRHFSKEELLNTSQLIDCETIPDTSFTESVDETVLTKTRTSECTNATLLTEQLAKHFEDYHLNRQEETHEHDYNDKRLLDENKFVINDSATSYGNGEDCIQEYSLVITANEDTNNFQNITKKHPDQKDFFERTGSSHELRYGQGQVNYGLPDFSKVAPNVKIPKRNNNDKSGPVLKRTKFLPNLVGKSAVVKDVLETMNYFDSAELENQEEEMRIPELGQQLELLTKQAEAQNRIDHLRFNPKIYSHPESSNPNLPIHSRCKGTASEKYTFHPFNVPLQPMFGLSQTSYSGVQSERMISSLPSASAAGEIHCINPYNSLENKKKGEEMSHMLKEQAEQLKTKVEEFSKHLTQEAFPVQDRYLMLKELQGHLDRLERNYLATKEEHRDLQLWNYNHKSMNIGEFDPDRKVEGKIFSLGMMLEAVKEKIEDNICSPCPSLFTTSPMSPLLTPCESACSSCSLLPESSTVSSIRDSPGRRASKMNFFNNEGNEGESRSLAVDVIPEQTSQLSLPDDNFDLFPEVQLGLQERDASSCIKGVEPLEKAGLPANKPSSVVMAVGQQCFHPLVADNGIGDKESHRQLTLSQKYNADQENPNGGLNSWQMKSSHKSKPYNMCNLKHKIIYPNMRQEQVYLTHTSDHCFCERIENCSNEYDASLHPKCKIHRSKKANKELGSCSFKRNKKTEGRKSEGEKSKSGMYSIFIQEKEVELDLSGSDSEDILFCDSFNESHSGEFLEHRTDNYKSCRAGLKEQSKGFGIQMSAHVIKETTAPGKSDKDSIVSSQEKRIASNSVCTSKQPDQFVYRLSDRHNRETPKTCYSRMHDKITLLPQYVASRKVYGSKSMINIRNNDTDTKLLNSSLDQAIQIATSLKETTERMVQVVAEDLAKAKTHRKQVTAEDLYLSIRKMGQPPPKHM